MTVRLATTTDIDELLDIEEEFRAAGTPSWSIMDRAWFERKISHEEILVPDDVSGYLTWTTLWRMPWIEFVRVRAARRRQGIGAVMVRALEDRLRERGGWFLVSSTSEGEDASIAWHTAIGFGDGGRVRWDMWPGAPDEVLLYKKL
ncbi:MAG: N-acetyltransferase family protein [Actinomycetota bacterium]